MKHLNSFSSLSVLLLPLVSANTGAVTCNNIQVKKHKYDFSALDKPTTVWVLDEDSPPAVYNTTWTVNICSQLKIDKEKEAEDQCKASTNSRYNYPKHVTELTVAVCGVRRSWNPADDPDKEHVQVENVIPLAGHWPHDGKPFEHWWTPIEASDDHPGGIEFKVDGAKYGKFKQRAFIDFQCEPSANEEEKRDDEDKPKQSEGDLQFISYDVENDDKYSYETLRLQWKTKYACSDYKRDAGKASSSWGFFTWFILM